MLAKQCISALALTVALLSSGTASAQDLNLSAEELQAFLSANQGLPPEELAARQNT